MPGCEKESVRLIVCLVVCVYAPVVNVVSDLLDDDLGHRLLTCSWERIASAVSDLETSNRTNPRASC